MLQSAPPFSAATREEIVKRVRAAHGWWARDFRFVGPLLEANDADDPTCWRLVGAITGLEPSPAS
jgi:hypothetical protein